MKVILRENVPALGNVGDIVSVSAGHARNYLVPRNFAIIADEGNKKMLENERKALTKKVEETKKAATDLKSKLDGVELVFTKRISGNGTLFGAVNANDISKALEDEKGLVVEKRLIHLPQPVKTAGEFEAFGNLFTDVQAQFKVRVEMDPKQVEEIKKKQEAAAKKKKSREEDKAEGGEAVEAKEKTEEVAQTEEQRLDEETNKILRS